MRFTLYYRGPLKADGSPTDKHALRQRFHAQMRSLWDQEPLKSYLKYLGPPTTTKHPGGLVHPVGPFTFVPLVRVEHFMFAELDLTMLRPEAPGRIVTQGGDIDNRLKTLLDSLKMPTEGELPNGAQPQEAERPFFFCLLEDDSLVTRLSIRTSRLLEPNVDGSEVVLLVDVTVRVTVSGYWTSGLGS